jgi:hypothetical protein
LTPWTIGQSSPDQAFHPNWGSRGRRFKSCQPDWEVEVNFGSDTHVNGSTLQLTSQVGTLGGWAETIGHELGIEERISEKIAINKGV